MINKEDYQGKIAIRMGWKRHNSRVSRCRMIWYLQYRRRSNWSLRSSLSLQLGILRKEWNRSMRISHWSPLIKKGYILRAKEPHFKENPMERAAKKERRIKRSCNKCNIKTICSHWVFPKSKCRKTTHAWRHWSSKWLSNLETSNCLRIMTL